MTETKYEGRVTENVAAEVNIIITPRLFTSKDTDHNVFLFFLRWENLKSNGCSINKVCVRQCSLYLGSQGADREALLSVYTLCKQHTQSDLMEDSKNPAPL